MYEYESLTTCLNQTPHEGRCSSGLVWDGIIYYLNYNTLFIYFFLNYLQIHLDPFEELTVAAKNAEEHRRSASETEVWSHHQLRNSLLST